MGDKSIYSVGIYARLSVDSHNHKNDSIETQVEIAREYMEKQPDMALYGCYRDLGRTGTDFTREGFMQLMQDVRRRAVNCIIVKDFSRFGRNYIEVGNYLEKIFPFLGVRFISVTDNFDSLKTGSNPDVLGINLKNLVNELYAKEISMKVRASKRLKGEQGSFTGGLPAYGYRAKLVDGKRTLIPETEAAQVVQKLFERFVCGDSQKTLIEWLYEERIHRPREYRKNGHVRQQGDEPLYSWSHTSIQGLLQNPVYMGHLHIPSPGDGTQALWGTNTHESIITQKQFWEAAERFKLRFHPRNRRDRAECGISRTEDYLSGLLFCGECKRAMSRIGSKSYVYCCKNLAKAGLLSCEKKYLPKNALNEIIVRSLRKEFWLHGIVPEPYEKRRRQLWKQEKKQLERERRRLENRLEEKTREICKKYEQYRQRNIDKEAFLQWKKEKEEQAKALEDGKRKSIETFNRRKAQMEKQCGFLHALLDWEEEVDLNIQILSALIQRIEVYPDKRISIFLCFTEGNPFYGK